MKKLAHFPSVRLATAGFASMLLLAWLGFIPDGSPLQADPKATGYPVAMLCTALLALSNLVVLAPVFRHGPSRDRWLAALATVFPLVAFLVTLLWFTARIAL